MKTVSLLLLLISCSCFPGENGQWFCEIESGKREGGTIWSCGVADGVDEGGARANALKEAYREFYSICNESSDCADKPKVIDPQRTSCKIKPNGLWKCVRLIVVTLQK
jgi:hypothetical protein